MRASLEEFMDQNAGRVRGNDGIWLVDSLGELEARELRILHEAPESERQEIFRSRAESPETEDVYRLLKELGYINCIFNPEEKPVLRDFTYKGSWALARYDERIKREDEERARRKRDRIFDRVWSVVIALISGGCGVAATLIVQHLSG